MRRTVFDRAETCRGPLILVNATHPVSGEYTPELISLEGGFPGIRMERRAAHLLAACIRAAGGSGVILPVSGWRSGAEQQATWDDAWKTRGEAFTRRYVALPGCSEHQTGLAVDLAERAEHIDWICPSFPHWGPCGAFRRLAAQYGFLQRYSREKEALTGIGAEPWHFRYVGAPHALLMEQNGLCLEEYAAFLSGGPRSCALPGGRRARVFRISCPGGRVEAELPEGCCQISGDNQGGLIVTQWEEAACV